MHKSTATNSQNRVVRATLNNWRNEDGAEAAFEGEKDIEKRKDALVAQQCAVDGRIAALNARIQRADAVVREGGGRTPAKTYGGWKIERAELIQERAKVVAELAGVMKRFAAKEREARLKTFDCVFVDVAREMLAAEVFQRLQIATLHRLQERAEGEQKFTADWRPPASVRQ